MIIRNGTLVFPDRLVENGNIVIRENRITDICANLPADTNEETLDAGGNYICPGLVDIHTHGGGGGDFMDCTDEAFKRALRFHTEAGTTALLATSVTAPVGQIESMLEHVRKFMNHENCCRVLGAHIEGPYLSLKNKGAQHEKYLRTPAKDRYDFIINNSDVIRTVTIAPELDGAAEMTKLLTRKGIVVCGGHDDGDKAKIMPAIEAGLSHCTHLWCAMSGAQLINGVRSAGLIELGLCDDRLSVELIADGFHMPYELVQIIRKCKNPDSVCIVSDCLRAGGLPENGKELYTLGSIKDENAQKFVVCGGVARLPDGSKFAGSVQPLSRMVGNLVRDYGIPLFEAVRMASLNPAKVIKMDHRMGSIETGKLADFCIMDKNLKVNATMVSGKMVYALESKKGIIK